MAMLFDYPVLAQPGRQQVASIRSGTVLVERPNGDRSTLNSGSLYEGDIVTAEGDSAVVVCSGGREEIIPGDGIPRGITSICF